MTDSIDRGSVILDAEYASASRVQRRPSECKDSPTCWVLKGTADALVPNPIKASLCLACHGRIGHLPIDRQERVYRHV